MGITNTLGFAIGESLEYTGRYWNGWMDEVAIYNKALSATALPQQRPGAEMNALADGLMFPWRQ